MNFILEFIKNQRTTAFTTVRNKIKSNVTGSNRFKLYIIHLHRLSKRKLACVSVFVFVSLAFFCMYFFVVFSSSSLLSFYLLSLIFIVILCMETYNLSRALEKNNNRAKRATHADDVERNILFFSSIHIICCNFQH